MNTPRLRKGGGIASSSLIFYLYWYSYIVHFVCASASEFRAMGSTSFSGFFYPKGSSYGNKILYKYLNFFDKIFVRKSCRRRLRNALYGEKILLMGKCFVWAWFRQTCICSSMRGRYKIQSAEG